VCGDGTPVACPDNTRSCRSGKNLLIRGRHKDALLQENGYFILRFLARDVSQNLDDVLDAILRRMGSERR